VLGSYLGLTSVGVQGGTDALKIKQPPKAPLFGNEAQRACLGLVGFFVVFFSSFYFFFSSSGFLGDLQAVVADRL